MKTYKCWTWKNNASHSVTVEAPNGYQAQKKAARKMGVRMLKVAVKEWRTDLLTQIN